MNVQELVNQIRMTEALFSKNETNETSEWIKAQRRQELSQVLLLLRRDLTDLVELSMAEETLKVA